MLIHWVDTLRVANTTKKVENLMDTQLSIWIASWMTTRNRQYSAQLGVYMWSVISLGTATMGGFVFQLCRYVALPWIFVAKLEQCIIYVLLSVKISAWGYRSPLNHLCFRAMYQAYLLVSYWFWCSFCKSFTWLFCWNKSQIIFL
jgi:hypothetical protein